jgi:hypothetical protein
VERRARKLNVEKQAEAEDSFSLWKQISFFPECAIVPFLFSSCFLFLSQSLLLATLDGPTAFPAFPPESRNEHFSTPVPEMLASFTSPSLKSGMTHVTSPE